MKQSTFNNSIKIRPKAHAFQSNLIDRDTHFEEPTPKLASTKESKISACARFSVETVNAYAVVPKKNKKSLYLPSGFVFSDGNPSGIQRTTQRARDKRIMRENSEQIVKPFYYNCNGMAQKRWQSRGGGGSSSRCC